MSLNDSKTSSTFVRTNSISSTDTGSTTSTTNTQPQQLQKQSRWSKLKSKVILPEPELTEPNKMFAPTTRFAEKNLRKQL